MLNILKFVGNQYLMISLLSLQRQYYIIYHASMVFCLLNVLFCISSEILFYVICTHLCMKDIKIANDMKNVPLLLFLL